MRRLFAEARAVAPCVLLLDEIDAICTKRSDGGDGGDGGHGIYGRILSTLLNEMDGIEASGRVVLVATTSRPDALDEVRDDKME